MFVSIFNSPFSADLIVTSPVGELAPVWDVQSIQNIILYIISIKSLPSVQDAVFARRFVKFL